MAKKKKKPQDEGVVEEAPHVEPEQANACYKVADGRSICCGARAMLKSGDSVEPRHLCSDEDVAAASFTRLIERGVIVQA